jgi:HlyD family secretion protein
MSKKLKWILISVGALLVLLTILSKAGVFGKDEGKKVTAEKVQKRTIIEVVNASGKIYPEIEVKVSPEISGIITELNVLEGDTVKKGQVLARIDADQYNIQRSQAAGGVAQSQAQVNASQANVSNSQAALDALNAQQEQNQRNYDRLKQLFEEKVISRSELEVAEASLRSAKANYNAALQGIKGGSANVQSALAGVQQSQATLQRANKDLSRTIITAPTDGVVSLLNVKKGESVSGNSFNVGTEILRIADMQKIEVRVDVGENDIPKVKLGDSALIEVDAYTGRKFKGLVTQIASSNNGAAAQNALSNVSSDVTQYKVYIRILAESYMDLLGKGTFPFRPGMSASADIQTKTHTNVLSVPINAITTREKGDTLNADVVKKKKDESDIKEQTINADDLDVVAFILQKDGTVKKVKVKTDIQDINNIEVTEGLKEGDEVITGPYELISKKLKEKDKVKKVEKKDLFDK